MIKINNKQALTVIDVLNKGKIISTGFKDIAVLYFSDEGMIVSSNNITAKIGLNISTHTSNKCAVNREKIMKAIKSFNKCDFITIGVCASSPNKLTVDNMEGASIKVELVNDFNIIDKYIVSENNSVKLLELPNAKELGDIFKKLSHSMAKHDVRKFLNGITLKYNCNNGILSMYGVDGYRIAFSSIYCRNLKDFSVIIEGKYIKSLIQILNTKSPVNISYQPIENSKNYNKNMAVFDIVDSNITVFAELIDADIVDISPLIPENLGDITVDLKKIKAAVKLILSQSEEKLIKQFTISYGGNKSILLSSNGDSDVEVKIPCNSSREFSPTSYNCNLFIDILNNYDEKEFKYTITDMEGKPNLKGALMAHDSTTGYVLMPINNG